jgi:hypothetical protein
MSYARWGWEGSDVYVFGAGSDAEELLVCMHMDGVGDFSCKTEAEMIAHLLWHRDQGQTVPEYAFERLREESEEG